MAKELEINGLEKLQENLSYVFKDKSLLIRALVHSSYSNENPKYKNKHNERLEFLGDAVLELVFSELLFRKFSHVDEGTLTKYRAKLVCEKSFSNLSEHFLIPENLILGKGEEATGGRNKDSLKADAFEAMCGAIYLDGGLEVVQKIIASSLPLILAELEDHKEVFIDYKTRLQEFLQKKKKSEFKYILCKEDGKSHDKTFYMDVYLNSKLIGSGHGKSKKQAEQMAAKDALKRFGVLNV
ncbi:MAG: ribonuclease III [Tissierellia bacterium]|nr:ribonuclease III [Tissierellia bacterium]